ncbi:hypothetical protein WR25_01234 isoform A [Diploscapter pachys]|nr:hypothetical protein WR25_01234 isoform A [Diploscapter pachys]
MKQLYDDYEPETPEIARTTKKPKPAIVLPIPPPRQILPPLSAFPSGDSNSMPPSHPTMVLPPGAPSGIWGNPKLATTLEPTQRTTTTQLPPTTSIIIQPMINRLVTKGDIKSKEMTLQQLMESNSKNGIPLDESSIVLPENLSPQLIAEIMAEPDDESEEDYEDAEAATTEKIAWEKSSTRKILKTPDSDAIRKKATTTQNPNFFKINENDADDEVQRQIQRMQVSETSRTTSSITTTTTTAPSTPLTTVTEPETTSATQIVTTAQTSTVPITSSEEIIVTAATQQLETSTEQQQQQVEAAGKASEFSMSDSDFGRRFTTNDEFGSEEEKNKSNEQMNVKPELHIKHDFGNNIQRVDFDSNIGIVLPVLPTQPPTSGVVITEEIPAMQPTAPAKLFKVVQPSVPMTAPRLPFGFSPKSSEVEKVYDSKSVQPQKQVIAATEQQESAEIVEVIQTTTTRKPRKPKLKKHKLGKNKRRKLSRRLKMLNNKIKVSEIALLPTELAFKLPESEGRKVLPLTTIATISERKVNRTLEKIDKLLERIETEGVRSNTVRKIFVFFKRFLVLARNESKSATLRRNARN